MPAHPEVVPGTFQLSKPSPVALEPVWIEATLQNKGLEDAPGLVAQAYAEGRGGQRELIAQEEVILLGGESVPVRFEWYPVTPGPWQVTLELNTSADSETAIIAGQSAASLDVQVASPFLPSAAEIWRLSNAGTPLALLLLLAAAALAVASLLLVSVHRVGRQS